MFTGGFCHENLLFCCFNPMIDSWTSGAGTRYPQPILRCTDWLQMTSPEQVAELVLPLIFLTLFWLEEKETCQPSLFMILKKNQRIKVGTYYI